MIMMPEERYKKLKEYLSAENPVLLDVIGEYKKLDKIAYKIGLLDPQESYTSHISWWPMISVLGTFSAGKSTFINEYVGQPIQQHGNQAVDDKFTVICYGNSKEPTTLPGLALDADPRFPFYNISDEINNVDAGEGNRVNMYLQLKTIRSDRMKGKILIDSPGFDADSQRDAILRITSHMVEMSDLILIFFDARHPEPGAMRDTLEHLVGTTMKHRDANKVLYILNQIDTTAKEDNLEDVIASWQRALAKEGLVSGNFYGIYNENAAVGLDDTEMHARLKGKKDADMERIIDRMDKVSIERAYRIVKALDDFSKEISEEKLPKLREILSGWRRKVLWSDLGVALVLLGLIGGLGISFGLFGSAESMLAAAVLFVVFFFIVHLNLRGFFARRLAKQWQDKDASLAKAIRHNTKWWRTLFSFGSSWHKKSQVKLNTLVAESKKTIQKLNDQFLGSNTPVQQPVETEIPADSNEVSDKV